MTDCNRLTLRFPSSNRRKVEASFTGGEVTSDSGALVLAQADRRSGLLSSVARKLDDTRRTRSCDHSMLSLLRQRVYGIALGYEDLNDHETLRHDIAIQTSVNRDKELASASTLCRLENRADRKTAWAMHEALFERFVSSHATSPRELVLDFDPTDIEVHGRQEGRFFHGYYDHYCFLPLYVFCGDHLLVAYLRPSKIDGAKHAWAVLALLVKALRRVWPEVRITFRGDSGFCRDRILKWCEGHGVGYIVGAAKNARLVRLASGLMEEAREAHAGLGAKQRIFGDVRYAARTWNADRRVIAKAEHGDGGANPRFVVTNLDGDAQGLYDDVYCARGEMENRIKETQLDMFSGRTSCTGWWANQFRLLLSGLAYCLMETVRRVGLAGTEMARARCGTIRLKLMKIGAVVVRNTRRVVLMMSSAYPYKNLLATAVGRLSSG